MTAARLIRTCVTCAHTYSYILYVYIMIQLQHYAVLLHVVGTQEIGIQHYILLCACARTLVHVPGTYNTILYILCNDKTATTAVVVLQLLALSAAACLTL